MHADVWIKRDDVVLGMAGLLLAITHVAFLLVLVLWFSLRKPTSAALLGHRLRAVLNDRPMLGGPRVIDSKRGPQSAGNPPAAP